MTEDRRTMIESNVATVYADYGHRVALQYRRYEVTSLWDIPIDRRHALATWLGEELRKAYGLDPKWGDMTPELRRALWRERYDHERAEREEGMHA
jgi:hypothetical protein